jgi:hypothetical protein
MHRVSLTMPAPKPEVWCASTADVPVVVLTIPGVLDRTRVFDVDVQLRVRVPAAARKPEFGLSLEMDGARQWSRSIEASSPGETDSLDYHCRLTLATGRESRLRARAALGPCVLLGLSLTAVEDFA